MAIHVMAVVDRKAHVDSSASVGAYAVVCAGAEIGAGAEIYPHVYISEGARIGPRTQIHPFAVISHHPQDVKWKKTPSYARIGADCVIREHATVHRGTEPESETIIEDGVTMFAGAHVAHNCHVEAGALLMNQALLAGHVRVGRKAIISGGTGAHQFCRIGEMAMLAGGLRVTGDVPPFMMLGPAGVMGPNTVGLRRAGVDAETRQELRHAHRLLYRSGLPLSDAIARVTAEVRTDLGKRLAAWLNEPRKRALATGPRHRGVAVTGED
ncbi:MAG: acyl-ACP--UDP-N-acetylglucosamine O-acyltransferase [Phycisphaerales bacterium]|nr:acyl-ACP--UDP-N-acetylglucosamine O-acyltransferase [Phycisphaerales bacterium]